MTGLNEPSFLGTSKIGLFQGDVDGSMMSWFSMSFVIVVRTSFLLWGSLYAGMYMGFAPGCKWIE